MRKKIPYDTKTYKFYDANPKGKKTGDCVIRAISTATGLSWDAVYDALCEYGRKYKQMPNDMKCYSKFLKDLGWVKEKQPRKSDNTKYTGSEFCEWLDTCGDAEIDTIIMHIGSHHLSCISIDQDIHKVIDTWNCSNRCVGSYWIYKG